MTNYFVSKRLIYLFATCIILVLISGCTPHQEPVPIQRSPIFEWEKQIIPGQTSSTELVSIWGEPDEIVNGGDTTLNRGELTPRFYQL
jgi:hypothetical protein